MSHFLLSRFASSWMTFAGLEDGLARFYVTSSEESSQRTWVFNEEGCKILLAKALADKETMEQYPLGHAHNVQQLTKALEGIEAYQRANGEARQSAHGAN